MTCIITALLKQFCTNVAITSECNLCHLCGLCNVQFFKLCNQFSEQSLVFSLKD